MEKIPIWLLFLVISIINVSAIEIREVSQIKSEDTGTVITRHIYGNGCIADISSNRISYIYSDRIRSNRLIINPNNEITREFKSLPFGQELTEGKIRYTFATAKEFDGDLYYFGARYYDPNLGKFNSVDPIKENHAYTYADNKPSKYVDPSGRSIELPQGEIERKKVFEDLTELVGKDILSITEEEGRYFISLQDKYKGNYPESFSLLKELGESKENILIGISSESNPVKLNYEFYKITGNGKDNIYYTLTSTYLGQEIEPLEVFLPRIRTETWERPSVNTKVVGKTLSGSEEVYYTGKNRIESHFEGNSYREDLELPSSLVLAHELSHALYYFRNDPNYGHVGGEFNIWSSRLKAPDPTWELENKIRKEHNIREREYR